MRPLATRSSSPSSRAVERTTMRRERSARLRETRSSSRPSDSALATAFSSSSDSSRIGIRDSGFALRLAFLASRFSFFATQPATAPPLSATGRHDGRWCGSGEHRGGLGQAWWTPGSTAAALTGAAGGVAVGSAGGGGAAAMAAGVAGAGLAGFYVDGWRRRNSYRVGRRVVELVGRDHACGALLAAILLHAIARETRPSLLIAIRRRCAAASRSGTGGFHNTLWSAAWCRTTAWANRHTVGARRRGKQLHGDEAAQQDPCGRRGAGHDQWMVPHRIPPTTRICLAEGMFRLVQVPGPRIEAVQGCNAVVGPPFRWNRETQNAEVVSDEIGVKRGMNRHAATPR